MRSGAALQAAGIAGAVVLVAGTGLASARFVDYLADRAMARTASALPGIEAAAAAPAAVLPVKQEPATKSPRTAAKPVAVTPPDSARPAPIAAEQPRQAAPAGEPQPDWRDEADERGTDRTFTAAIARPAAPLPVIEEPAITDGASERAAIAAAELPDAAAAPVEPTRSAKVNNHVNLRAGPRDEAKVLAVVPAQGTVQVVNCDGWCEVQFEGQTGFIYKSFIGG